MPDPPTTIITITTTTTMDERQLFQLMSWLSPAFPVGGFSYSHGLEYAVEAGLVRDEASLEEWTQSCLRREIGPVCGGMLRAAREAAASGDSLGLSAALEEARAFVATPEFELESKAQGQAFILALRAAWPLEFDRVSRVLAEDWVPYASAVGIAAGLAGIGLRPALVAYLQSVGGNLLSAGIRLIPLGQTAGQRILARLQNVVLELAEDVLERAPQNIGACAPLIEWTSMKHETQYTRLFRS